MSYPEIAEAMGRNNHSTTVTMAQRHAAEIARDRVLDFDVQMDSVVSGARLADVEEWMVTTARRLQIREAVGGRAA